MVGSVKADSVKCAKFGSAIRRARRHCMRAGRILRLSIQHITCYRKRGSSEPMVRCVRCGIDKRVECAPSPATPCCDAHAADEALRASPRDTLYQGDVQGVRAVSVAACVPPSAGAECSPIHYHASGALHSPLQLLLAQTLVPCDHS